MCFDRFENLTYLRISLKASHQRGDETRIGILGLPVDEDVGHFCRILNLTFRKRFRMGIRVVWGFVL